MLVIDDFGRQRCSARDLLNRWIVPLESRVDFLTLNNGQKFELPFLLLVVFATNIRPVGARGRGVSPPHSLQGVLPRARRSPISSKSFQVLRRTSESHYDDALIEELLQNYYRPRKLALRGCHPRDLLDQALAQASYLGEERRLTTELLEAACASYFVDDTEPAPVFV